MFGIRALLLVPLVLLCSGLAAQYTPPTYTNTGLTGDWISNITIGSWNQNIPQTTSDYTYNTGQGPGVLQGTTPYTANLTNTSSYNHAVSLFADNNQDGDFADAGEHLGQVWVQTATSNTLNFTIPGTAASGNTRLRLLVVYDFQGTIAGGTPMDPAGTYGYGQCDDYDLTISNGSNVTAQRSVSSFPTSITNNSTVNVALGSSVASLDMLFTIQNGNTTASNTLTAVVTPSANISGFVQAEWEATGVAGTTTAPATGTFTTAGAITVGLTCTDGSTTGVLNFTLNVVAGTTTVANNNIPGVTVPPGVSNFAATSVDVSSNVVNQTVTSVTLTKTGSTADVDILAARLIVDANSNNVVDTGEVQLGTDQTFSGGTATFSLTVPVAGSVDIIIAVDMSPTASGSFGVNLTAVSVTPGTIAGLPVTGATHSLLTSIATLPFSDNFDGPAPANRQFQTTGSFPGGTGTTISMFSYTNAATVATAAAGTATPVSTPNQLEIGFPNSTACGAALYYFNWSAFSVASEQIIMSFSYCDNSDEDDVEDGIFISLDGGTTWAMKLWDSAPLSRTDNVHAPYSVNITTLLAAASLNYTSAVVIRIQGQDDSPYTTGNDGHAYDNLVFELLDDPEINVVGPSTGNVASGSTVNIGNVNVGGATAFTWTVQNLGLSNNLSVTGISAAPSGVGNCTIGAPTLTPPSPITPTSSATFDTSVTPSATGPFEFTITINNNDPNEGTYTIIVQGTGVAPTANIQRPAATVIANGTTDTVTQNTSPSGPTTVTWTIGNTGAGTLNITSVVTSNTSNCTAVVTGPVSATVAPAGTTTFSVDITPTAVGAWSFDITLNSNDPVTPAYAITVDGTATLDPPSIQAPFVAPASSPILITEQCDDPDTSGDEYIELTNVSGVAVDTTGWQFLFYPSSSTTVQFTLTLTAGTLAPGATWVITDNANPTTANPPANQYIGGNIGSLQDTGHVLLNSVGDIMDAAFFGNANPAGITLPVTIGAEWVGATAANNVFSADSAKRIGVADNNDASDWASVTGSLHSFNTANAGLTLPFSITAGATVGGAYPNYTGSIFIGDSLAVDFTATDPNPGDTLNFNITVTGGTLSAAQAGFAETFPYAPTGGSSPHTASLSGTAAMAGTIELTVQVSDGGLNDSYTYTLTIDTPPEMDVLYNAAPVADGGTVNQTMVNVGFTQFTFTIENNGGLDVNLTGTPLVQVTAGTNLFSAAVSQNPTTPIAGSGSTTFTIDVTPLASATGTYDFTVSIDNDDPDENPYDFTVTGSLISNIPPAVTVSTGSNWVNAGGGLFTLTVDPGDTINDSLEVDDATPDNMTTTVTNPATAMLGLTAQPVSVTTPTAGPILLTWVGTAGASNAPGNFDWLIDIDDGTTVVSITARIILNDVDPQHTAATGITGDGSVATPYAAQFVQGDPVTTFADIANVTDPNTNQTLALQNVNRTGGTAVGGSGFTFSLAGGVLSANPAATLVANDVGTNIYTMEVSDGTGAPVTINVTLTVLGASGAITFTNASPLPAATVSQSYNVTLAATGGTGPYTFAIVNSTSLPVGLTLNPTTGAISGTPTATGVYTFDVRAFDSLNDTGTMTFQLQVNSSGSSGSSGSGSGGGGGCVAAPSNWSALFAILFLLGAAAIVRRRTA